MSSAATNFPFCLDYDSWTSSLLIGYGAHFRSAAVQLGHPNATSCGELAARWCKFQIFLGNVHPNTLGVECNQILTDGGVTAYILVTVFNHLTDQGWVL